MAYKVSVVSLGCPKNQVDAEMMLKALVDGGFELSTVEAEADAIIINTCCFIKKKKKEAIENILDCAAYKKDGNLKALIVTGCLAERYKDDITEEIPEVDLVVGIGSNSKIAELTLAAIENRAKNSYGPKEDLDLNAERILGGMPFTAYIKVSDGCDNCCTYCAIPKIRGRLRSRTIEDIVKEAKTLSKQGVTELIVVGQDTTAYGEDLYGVSKLPELLEELCKIEGIHWIRTLYTYPDRITHKLLKVIKENEKLVKYLDIPLQHIDGDILKRMNRKGDEASLRALIAKIRKEIPEITLRTTFITGFPGETDELFMETYNFLCNVIRPAFIHIFPYSRRSGTPAAERKDQVQDCIKTKRVQMLEELCQRLHEEFIASNKGIKEKVLFESTDRKGMMEGYTGNYIRVSRPYDPDMIGKIAEIEI